MDRGTIGRLGVLFSIALTPILATCGGSSGSCGKVAPCGGDVVGNWTINGACLNSAALTMNLVATCPGASISVSSLSVHGDASFNADLTYSVTETVSVSATETIPTSCLQLGGITLTCAQLDQSLQDSIAADPTMYQSAHCSGSATCTCSFTLAPRTMTETGTYATSGTTITTTASDGTSASSDYCRQGNELHLVSLNMTMPMGAMGQANIDADTVLTKK
jgi:hypothetical protein